MTSRFFTLLFLAVAGHAFSQQLPQYSTWLLNPYLYNPAAAGLDNSLVLNGIYRKQWIDLDGAPVSQHINAHLPVYFLHSGAGIKIDNDRIGAHQTTQVLLTWDYQMEFGKHMFSFGLSAGYQQYSMDGSRLRAPQGDYNDPAFQHNDDYLPLGRISLGAPVIEFGAYYMSDKLEAGLSSQPVFVPVLKEKSPGKFQLTPQNHYLVSLAYKFHLGEDFLLKPGILLKTDFAVTQSEISALAFWKEKFYAMAAYRGFSSAARDAAVLSGGIKINEKTTAIYAYDIPLSALKTTNRGSHELTLRYTLDRRLGVGKLPPVIYNPRF